MENFVLASAAQPVGDNSNPREFQIVKSTLISGVKAAADIRRWHYGEADERPGSASGSGRPVSVKGDNQSMYRSLLQAATVNAGISFSRVAEEISDSVDSIRVVLRERGNADYRQVMRLLITEWFALILENLIHPSDSTRQRLIDIESRAISATLALEDAKEYYAGMLR